MTAHARRTRAEHDFVVNAAHEFLSPLTAIAGAAYVLQESAKDEPAVRDRFIGHIVDAANRLISIARAVLVLARVEAGVEPPRLELVPLRPLLDEVAATAKEGVSVTACSRTAAVLADRDLLRQAISNLVENAKRHSNEVIEIVVDERGERMTAIEIIDRGSGILPEHLERVTRRFFTAGGRDSDGYGIGLSLAARAIDILGGTLALESGREGTRARIEVPSAHLVAA
jgi:two-component system phosphate regulon sensor histidine kinase PhoR